MKKTLSTLFAVLCASSIYAAPATSTIQLDIPNNGVVQPQNTTLSIPLKQLYQDTLYQVTCTIENPDDKDGTDLRFSYAGAFGFYPDAIEFNLNGTTLKMAQGTAKPGQNTFTFYAKKMADDDAFAVTNLDTLIAKPVKISDCFGKPVIGVK